MMKKLFVNLEKEIPISKLEEYLEEFEKRWLTDCLSLFLRHKDKRLAIHCQHPFTRATGCADCHICVTGKYNRKEILDYVKMTSGKYK